MLEKQKDTANKKMETNVAQFTDANESRLETISDNFKIRSVLAGLGLESTLNDVERAETGIIDLVAATRSIGEPRELYSGTCSILSLVETNEGEIVFGGTDKTIRTLYSNETAIVDAPPVVLAVRPRQIPTELACGTLSGSIEIFNVSSGGVLENRRRLDSPHRKHICGMSYDPVGTGKLATVSKDGILVFWSEDKSAIEGKIGFQAERPPECWCAVTLDGKGFLAVGKRNHNILSLIPFESPSDFASHIEVKLDPLILASETPSCTPLAMSSFASLPLLAVAMDTSRVCLYDLTTKRQVREFNGHICDEFARPGLAWDARGELLAITSNPNKVFVFRVNMPLAPPLVIEDHRAVVRCVKFLIHAEDDTQELVTASFDKRILLRPIL